MLVDVDDALSILIALVAFAVLVAMIRGLDRI
jgi:hypothetical protein